MEYGTWLSRAKEETSEETRWRQLNASVSRAKGNLGLFGHVELTGHSCKRTEDGWRYCWRARIFGISKVAFVDCVDLVEGFTQSLRLLDTNSVTWFNDKYARDG